MEIGKTAVEAELEDKTATAEGKPSESEISGCDRRDLHTASSDEKKCENNGEAEESTASDQTEKTEEDEETTTSDKTENAEESEKATASDQTEKTEEDEETTASDQTEKTEEDEETTASDKTENAEESEKATASDQTEKTEEGEKAEGASKKSLLKKLIPLVYIALTGVALAVFGAVLFTVIFSRSVTCEAGDVPDYSHITENSVVSLLCCVEDDLEAIDTAGLGETRVSLRFFGFLGVKSRLRIRDTVAPVITPCSVYVTKGLEVREEMFVREAKDRTEITLEFTGEVSTEEEGVYRVTLKAIDGGLNVTEFSAELTVTDPKDSLSFEHGVTLEKVKDSFHSLFPHALEVQQDAVLDCGEFILEGSGEGSVFFARVYIADTLPPVAELCSFDIVLGETLTEEQFVKSINDHSEVTVEFLSLPDYSKAGEHQVRARFEDAFGNSSEYTCFVFIHDVETEITAEVGSSNEALAELIFKDGSSASFLAFQKEGQAQGLGIGAHELQLAGRYGFVTVSLTLRDTVPPKFSVQQMHYLVGREPDAKDFIYSCEDSTAVTYSFKEKPDCSKEGVFSVTVVATDRAGNSSEQQGVVVFYYDTEPPVISGYRDHSLIIGRQADFSQGVTAYDTVWGEVSVTVDTSAVNMNAAGEYPLVYWATDGSGNSSSVTVKVVLREPVRVCLNVPCIMQKPTLPNGCEVVALTMALRYNGFGVDPLSLFYGYMTASPFKAGDPWVSYVGDPTVASGGYGCFAPCVVETGNKYLDSIGSLKRMRNVSGTRLSDFTDFIDRGVPVLLWGTTNMSGNPRICWESEIDGKHVCWLSASHCLLLIGYTDDSYIFCDSLKGVTEYSKAAVEVSYNLNFRQACVLE